MFIDVHCHIDLCKNFENAIVNAGKANVKFISNAVSPENARKLLDIKSKHREVMLALGVYPVEALSLGEKIDDEIEFIRKNKDKIVAIGEVGLDFKEIGEKERQIENFKKFILLAKELDVPVIVHSRKAEQESVEVLREMGAKKVIMHCFFGSVKLVDEILKQGWSFSIPTSVCYNLQMQELASRVPIEQILCETDSPYMHPFRQRDNEPALVVEGYKKIAEIKGLNLKEFEKIVKGNYRKMFG